MKAVILAGGLGTRLAEETVRMPKPMVSIGGRPILWHIMKLYERHGVNDFVICLGYKGYVIKEWFANYALHRADVSIDLESGLLEFHRRRSEPWQVQLVDTGESSMTAGRLKRVCSLLNDTFLVTYGDGLSDIDITSEINFHHEHGRIATMAAVIPPARYGALELEGDRVASFREKPLGDGNLINGGFFVFEPTVFEYINGDESSLEEDTLPKLARNGELWAWRHTGFWQPMDTLRDKRQLEALYESSVAPWAYWLANPSGSA